MMNNALMSATPRASETIVNRMTRYAIECVIDGQVTVIGYTSRPSKHTLLRAAREQSAAILPFLTEDDRCSYRAGVFTLGKRVTLRVGNTERHNDRVTR